MKKSKLNSKSSSNSKKMIAVLVAALAALIILLILLSVLDGRDFQFGSNDTDDENGEIIDEANNEASRLIYIGNSEMYEILNDTSDEGFFVYIGRPTCPHCQQFEPTLEEVLQYLDQELRYYETDLATLDDEESPMTRDEILTEIDGAAVPRIVYIENGVVIDALVGNQPQEYVIAFFEANGGLN